MQKGKLRETALIITCIQTPRRVAREFICLQKYSGKKQADRQEILPFAKHIARHRQAILLLAKHIARHPCFSCKEKIISACESSPLRPSQMFIKPSHSTRTASINIKNANPCTEQKHLRPEKVAIICRVIYCTGHQTLPLGTKSRSYVKEEHKLPWGRYLSILKMRAFAETLTPRTKSLSYVQEIQKILWGRLLSNSVGTTSIKPRGC